ncbi:MAG: phytanoyl-CoA dioxygenase family protein [Sandaracinaceae bacterium]
MTEPHPFLAEENASSESIDERWAASNEQWWDWYMSLAFDDGGDRSPVAAPPMPDVRPASHDALVAELDRAYRVPEGARAAFRREGFVKLPGVLSPAALVALAAEWRPRFAAMGDAAMRFPSLEMLWTTQPVSRAFALSRRLGAIAAELLAVERVRLYHDNALSKLPGCGRTPWHYDAHHYPIDSDDVVTLWAPLQPTPRAMGPLAFARDIEAWRLVADLPFSKFDDSYDRGIAEALRKGGVPVEDGPFALGAVSFHHTRSLHTAGPNRTDRPRLALALTYLADGARLVEAPTLISGDFEKFMPGVGAGEPIASPLTPVVVDRSTFGAER